MLGGSIGARIVRAVFRPSGIPCLFGRHRMNRHVEERGSRLWSACARCDVPLVNDHRRQWVTIEEEERQTALRAQARQTQALVVHRKHPIRDFFRGAGRAASPRTGRWGRAVGKQFRHTHRLLCLFGKHRASRHVNEHHSRLWSACSRCHVPLVYDHHSHWVTIETEHREGVRAAKAGAGRALAVRRKRPIRTFLHATRRAASHHLEAWNNAIRPYLLRSRRLLCFVGHHHASRRVTEQKSRLWSSCSDCGVALVNDHRRRWVTIEADHRAAAVRAEARATRALVVHRKRPIRGFFRAVRRAGSHHLGALNRLIRPPLRRTRRLLCFVGHHHASRRVTEQKSRLWSNCSDCHVALVNDHRRRWLTIGADRREAARRVKAKATRALAAARKRRTRIALQAARTATARRVDRLNAQYRRLLCRIGRHRASRRVSERHGRLSSACSHCKTPLVRDHGRPWVTIEADQREAARRALWQTSSASPLDHSPEILTTAPGG